jgi:hypothetical protein
VNADEYTGPERNCEVAAAKRLRSAMLKKGPCFFCMHLIEGFELAACSTFGRSFPLCSADGLRPAFELDDAAMQKSEDEGVSHG